jgi:hypothetical protein
LIFQLILQLTFINAIPAQTRNDSFDRLARTGIWLRVSISDQSISLFDRDSLIACYPVSTSRFGSGNRKDSEKTPLGWHRICEKIGENAPLGMIFISRKPIGRIAVIYSDTTDTPEDEITTRILRLEGCEKEFNMGGLVDSYNRQIYIHGTPEEGLIGQPASHGCVRMKNQDIIDLFSRVSIFTYVLIAE